MHYLWAGPSTILGLALALTALRRGRIFVVDGVVEAHSPFLRWALTRLIPLPGGASAITFGHVVLARDELALDLTRAHERMHVAQDERLGPLFIPAYLLSGLWAYARGGHPYFDNRFEREAIRERGHRHRARLAQVCRARGRRARDRW